MIPISWYLINENNNQITIRINQVNQTYSFPYGNYNINTFINAWYNVVNGGKEQWNLSYNSTTNKLTIHNNLYTFLISDKHINSIFPILGFQKGDEYFEDDDNNITSEFVINFSGLSHLFIKSPTFGLNNIASRNNACCDNIIASIPVNASTNGVILYNNYSMFKSIFNNHGLNNIEIAITDDNTHHVNFNNVDWALTLQIDIIKESVKILDTVEEIYNNAK